MNFGLDTEQDHNVRAVDSGVGHLTCGIHRSTTRFHFDWTTSFLSDAFILVPAAGDCQTAERTPAYNRHARLSPAPASVSHIGHPQMVQEFVFAAGTVARVAPVEMPPSINSVCPVTYSLASDARNTTAPSRSVG